MLPVKPDFRIINGPVLYVSQASLFEMPVGTASLD